MVKKTKRRVVKSTCGLCAVGCGIRVHIEDDEVVKIEGDADNPLNRGELCSKGLARTRLFPAQSLSFQAYLWILCRTGL